jgi:large subunit ribosomal protein L6
MSSRVANSPINIPTGVEVNINNHEIKIKGPKGTLQHCAPEAVGVNKKDNKLTFVASNDIEGSDRNAGTTRAIVNNMVLGVTKGFEKKLVLIGVGFKAQAQGKSLLLNIGFSHPIKYPVPVGITIETPTQTEVVIKGSDKQLVGQVAAEVRGFRPPEPYKGKGIRYEGEVVIQKEGKKK